MTVSISGTLGVDLIKDGTVAQADLGANVAGNGPAFRATLSSPTVFVTGGVDLALTTVLYNLGGHYSAASGRFQPNAAGYYYADIYLNTESGAFTRTLLTARVNAGGGGSFRAADSQAPGLYIGGGGLVYLNGTTDYLAFNVYLTGSNLLLNTETRISAYLARSA